MRCCATVLLGQQSELFIKRRKALVDKPFAVMPRCIRFWILAKCALGQLELKFDSFPCFILPLITLQS